MKRINPPTVLHLSGFTCLNCGKGVYLGYSIALEDRRKKGTTLPCSICGDIRPSSISKVEFRRAYKLRDKRLYPNMTKKPKIKRLTHAQLVTLSTLGSRKESDFYDVLKVGGSAITLKKLVELGMATVNNAGDYKIWSITQAGSDAYATGKYEVP